MQPQTQQQQLLRTDVNAICWFEIPVKDLEKSKTFYEQVFGVQLESQRMDQYELAMFPSKMEFKGAAGCLSKGPEAEPSNKGTLVYFSVTDIEATCQQVLQNGGKVLHKKMIIGEHGFIAIVQDLEGNCIGLHCMT